jgi:hypothetical protein
MNVLELFLIGTHDVVSFSLFLGVYRFFGKYLDYTHHLRSCLQSNIHNLNGKLRNVIAYNFANELKSLELIAMVGVIWLFNVEVQVYQNG